MKDTLHTMNYNKAWEKERLGKATEGMKRNHSRSHGLMPGRILMIMMMRMMIL
jgi:hypothetical protein